MGGERRLRDGEKEAPSPPRAWTEGGAESHTENAALHDPGSWPGLRGQSLPFASAPPRPRQTRAGEDVWARAVCAAPRAPQVRPGTLPTSSRSCC